MTISVDKRPGSARHNATAPVAVGIDSLYVSAYVDGLKIDWMQLEYERENLSSSPGQEFSEIKLGNENFALRRGGRKPYTYHLSNTAFHLWLGPRIRPCCHAQLSSELLWSVGLENALKRFHAIWDALGTVITRPDVISRVDAAFDFKIDCPNFKAEHFLSKAAKDNTWRKNQRFQGFQFGVSDIVCRVYDKCAEIEEKSGKRWFYEIWGVREGIWRCEFQIRGKALDLAGVETIDQLNARLPGLVRKLARHHTSLRVPTGDTNRSRWPVHPMWRGIIAATDRLVSAPATNLPPAVFSGTEYALERQLRSIFGHLKSVAALLSRFDPDRPITLDILLARLGDKLRPYHCPALWAADVQEKIRKRELGL